jgi:hypothetical protein
MDEKEPFVFDLKPGKVTGVSSAESAETNHPYPFNLKEDIDTYLSSMNAASSSERYDIRRRVTSKLWKKATELSGETRPEERKDGKSLTTDLMPKTKAIYHEWMRPILEAYGVSPLEAHEEFIRDIEERIG